MKPNFLVAGVAKAGTTSLFYYLRQHPEISIPRKETFFFIHKHYTHQDPNEPGARPVNRIIRTEEEYLKLYSNCETNAIGEVSTGYAYYHEESIPAIQHLLGDPKIILVLRDPVDRIVSGYNHFRNAGIEPFELNIAIESERVRKEAGWDFMWQYTGLGFYADAVRAFQSGFSNVLIVLQEDIAGERANETMKRIFRFLRVDDSFVPDVSTTYNLSDSQQSNPVFRYFLSSRPIRKFLRPLVKTLLPIELKRSILHRLRKPDPSGKYRPDPEQLKKLYELYAEDIRVTQALIGRDLSHWHRYN
ncbi:MAG: sulfotransferase [Bacteroidota bacterium]